MIKTKSSLSQRYNPCLSPVNQDPLILFQISAKTQIDYVVYYLHEWSTVTVSIWPVINTFAHTNGEIEWNIVVHATFYGKFKPPIAFDGSDNNETNSVWTNRRMHDNLIWLGNELWVVLYDYAELQNKSAFME